MITNLDNLISGLGKALDTFGIPEDKKDLRNPDTVFWLVHNLDETKTGYKTVKALLCMLASHYSCIDNKELQKIQSTIVFGGNFYDYQLLSVLRLQLLPTETVFIENNWRPCSFEQSKSRLGLRNKQD